MEGSRFMFFSPDMIFRIPALLIALTIHEYAHARVAVALGDMTPKFQGRLTLNPVAHLDPFGLIMLWLAQFGWAKPVEVNARNFSNWRQGMMWVSLAGPGANLATAFVSMLLLIACVHTGYASADWLVKTLYMTIQYNIMFAVFNMLPIPPLDGSKVLMNFLPPKLAYQYADYVRYSTFILMALIVTGVVGFIISPISSFLYHSIRLIGTLMMAPFF